MVVSEERCWGKVTGTLWGTDEEWIQIRKHKPMRRKRKTTTFSSILGPQFLLLEKEGGC